MADTQVILNATRSEAADLLSEGAGFAPPPPRPLLQDSAKAESLTMDSASHQAWDLGVSSPQSPQAEQEERPGSGIGAPKQQPRVWAPPSRNAGLPARPPANGVGYDYGSDGGSPHSGQEEERPALSDLLSPAAPPASTPPPSASRQPPAVATPAAVVEGRVRSPSEVASESREGDVRAAFAGLPKIKPHWSHRYMKMLLVGESGLGKTTFVRNLFAAYARDASFPVNDASVPNAQRIFGDNPEVLCTEIVLQDASNKVYFHYLVQDTPGYGDSVDLASDRRLILDYIDTCSCQYLEQEQDPDRRAAMHAIRDTRVDVCLYFIPPHRLRQIDLTFISGLAGMVPVVPVLAKADTMTSEELKEFRHRVRHALHKAGVHSPFSRDALEDAGSRHGAGPFATIGSNTMDLEVGRFWPVRKYPWGSVEAMLTQHSDLPILRRLLFETGYCELKEATESRFHEFRHMHCSGGGRRGGLKGVLASLARLTALGGGLLLAGWLLTSGAPLLKDEVKRKETVRRVKEKLPAPLQVGEVVESAVDAVHEVGEKAQEAAAITKSTTSAAADVTKRALNGAASKAARAVESEDARKSRRRAGIRRRVESLYEVIERYYPIF